MAKKVRLSDLIISGYARISARKYVPQIICDLIALFYCENKYLIRYDYDKKIIKETNVNGIRGIFQGQELFVIDLYGKIYHYQNDEFRIDKYFQNSKMRLISGGLDSDHALLLTMNNKLYGYGSNECCQLGIDVNKNSWLNRDTWVNVVKIELNIKDPIINIYCGRDYSLILTLNGKVFGCGGNDHYQIGLPNDDVYETFTIIHYFKKKCIKIINTCNYTSYFIDSNGNLYACGANNDGLNGISRYGSRQKYRLQRINPINIKFDNIKVGRKHVIALTDKNELCSWGTNMFGQCGQGHSNDTIYKPTKIKFRNNMDNIKVNNYFCLHYSNIIIDNNNESWFFGKKILDFVELRCNPYKLPKHWTNKTFKMDISNIVDIFQYNPDDSIKELIIVSQKTLKYT